MKKLTLFNSFTFDWLSIAGGKWLKQPSLGRSANCYN